MIDVKISEILSDTISDCENVETRLKTAVNKLISAYDSVLTNVQSTELNKTIGVLKSDVQSVCDKMLTKLPATTEFLKTQMKAYSNVNENARTNVDSLISSIDSVLSGK